MDTEVRRLKHTLYYSGRAFIIFGIWSSVKVFLWLYLNPINWEEMFATSEIEQIYSTRVMNQIFYSLVFAVYLIIFCIRIYIGLSAIREGLGKHKKFTYVMISIIYMVLILSGYAKSFQTDITSEKLWLSLSLDVTNIIILTIIIIDAWKLRKRGE